MAGNLRIIYELRIQCPRHDLDKMLHFYRVPNATPSKMYAGHEKVIRQKWPKKYGCKPSEIVFSRSVVPDYRWDIKENRAVKVVT